MSQPVWEYRNQGAQTVEGIFTLLNGYGKDGWELIQIVPKGEDAVYGVFKRLKENAPAKKKTQNPPTRK